MYCSTVEQLQAQIEKFVLELVDGAAGKLLNSLSSKGFSDAEEKCKETGDILARELMKSSLLTKDKQLAKNVSLIDYKKQGFASRTIRTVFGKVEFERSRFSHTDKSKSGVGYYPLDEEIGLPRNVRLSPTYTNMMTNLSANTSYETAIETIDTITGTKVSRMGARDCVLNTAKLIEDEQKRNADSIWKKHEIVGKTVTDDLFIETDAVYIAEQKRNSKKRKSGKKVKKDKLRINMAKAYSKKDVTKGEQTIKEKDGKLKVTSRAEKKCDNTIVYGKSQDIRNFAKDAVTNIFSRFDATRVINCWHGTDGEDAFIKMTPKLHPDAKHVLDPCHIHSKISEKCSDKRFGGKLRKVIFDDNDVNGACELINAKVLDVKTTDSDRKKLTELYTYISGNKESIDMNNPSLGTLESTNGHVIGSRMKVYGGGWTKRGANAMVSVRCTIASGIELPVMTRAA